MARTDVGIDERMTARTASIGVGVVLLRVRASNSAKLK
jgi:hypothetical protein